MDKSIKKISVPVSVVKRKKYWVAYCPVLKTFGYSATSKDAALKDFDNAIDTFFHIQIKLGTLDQTLINLGWVKKGNIIKAPKINADLPPFRSTKTTRQINIPASC